MPEQGDVDGDFETVAGWEAHGREHRGSGLIGVSLRFAFSCILALARSLSLRQFPGVSHGDLVETHFDAFDGVGFRIQHVEARLEHRLLHAAFTGFGQLILRRLA